MNVNIEKIKDNDGHWYWIPKRLLCEFRNDLELISGIEYIDDVDSFDKFEMNYGKYRTLGDKDLIPDFFI